VVIVARILAFRSALSGSRISERSFSTAGLGFNKTYQFHRLSKADLVSDHGHRRICPAELWALVIGHMIEEIAGGHLELCMEPHSSPFHAFEIRDISSFSIWRLVKSMGGYLYRHLEKR